MLILAHTLMNTEQEDTLGVAINYGNRLLEYQLSEPPQEDTRSQSKTQTRRRCSAAVTKSSEVIEKEGRISEKGDTFPYSSGDQAVPKTDLGCSYNTREGLW
jgi:hypothetical protein